MRKGLTILLAVAPVLTVTAAASGRVQRLITGQDIQNNTISSADIKNNTIVRKDRVDSNQGFKLNFTNVLAGDSFVDATWAYTG